MKTFKIAIILLISLCVYSPAQSETLLVEAESFEDHGGWKMDTQFIEVMGSPYLLAHGLGRPVKDASTTVKFPSKGKWKVWVRTKDWVAPWKAKGQPGRFQLLVNGKALSTTFGTEGAKWHWQNGGEINVDKETISLSMHDLTGFDGRCDAIVFSNQSGYTPDNSNEILPAWRREALKLPAAPIDQGPYDIVYIGGGYAGAAGAISAARMGLKVALIQNRGVLGGNGSSEIRVWAKGNTPAGLYPVGDIIRELSDEAKASPGTYEEFGDSKKDEIAKAEKNLDLFLFHHGYAVEGNETHIDAVLAFDTRTGAIRRFKSRFFCDTTGHGTIGELARADRTMIDGGRMGMSNMWRWENTDSAKSFPETPWALDLDEGTFPYPRKYHAEWFWESGFDKHPQKDLEAIRDWNLRANFGAWNAMKNKGAYGRSDTTGADHKNAALTWMAYIGGPRETQQLLGDIILTEEDIVTKRPFPDGCVLTTWSVDLHYPKEQYVGKFSENPFISKAVHGKGVDRKRGYPVPYRCFYSRNIDNLFMAGRNISVTHKALGTVRVMKTCGMMGVVVGKAAAIAAKNECSPRDVYYQHLDQLITLLKMPGYMRRDSLTSDFKDDQALPHLSPPETDYIRKSSLSGIVIDDRDAVYTGKWTEGAGLKNYIEDGYHYHGSSGKAEARYNVKIPKSGKYEVRMSWQPHANRSSKTSVIVLSADGEKTIRVNQKISPPLAKGFYTLGVHSFEVGKPAAVIISNKGADGNVHADAVQFLPEN